MTALLLVDRSSGRTFAHFALEHSDDEVSVVGSFNDWVPGVHVLAPQDDGSRGVLVEVLHSGDVHFRYLASGGRWFDDPSAHVINEYGSTLHRDAAQETDVAGIAEGVAATGGDPVSDPVSSAAPAVQQAVAKKVAATKAAAQKAAGKRAAKAVATKAPAAKSAASKSAATKSAAKKSTAKSAAKKSTAKSAAKKSTAKSAAKKTAAATDTAGVKPPAKKAAAKAATKKSAAQKSAGQKSAATKAADKKS